jgi:HD-GYP domain-containing protein (c-di-GMP phosphodiesterase class II)
MKRKEKPRLLIFDDDKDLITSLTAYLENEYDIVAAATPEEAKRQFAEFTGAGKEFQVAVIDMWDEREFPVDKEAGLKIIRYVHEYINPPVCIVLTGHEEMGNIVACMEAGAFSYVLKGETATPLLLKDTLQKALIYIKEKILGLAVLSGEQRIISDRWYYRDPFYLNHNTIVAAICEQLANLLELPQADKKSLKVAAYYHEIGLGVLPFDRKPGRLTNKEAAIVKHHPSASRKILLDVFGQLPAEVLTAVEQYQANWDGSGFPEDLAGEEISLLARIIRVACEFAQCLDNPDKRYERDPQKAIESIEGLKGIKLAPKIVETLKTAYENRQLYLPIRWDFANFMDMERLIKKPHPPQLDGLEKTGQELIKMYAGEDEHEAAALWLAMGDLLYGHSFHGAAEKFYERATQHHPNFAEAYYKRGLALLQQGRWPEAERDFYVAGAILPTYIEAHQKRGETLLKGGLWEEALRAWDRVISLDDKNGEAYLLKAKCYESKAAEEEEPEKQKEFLRKAQNHRQKAEEI